MGVLIIKTFCQRDGTCGVLVGRMNEYATLPYHVCETAMRASCELWFKDNSNNGQGFISDCRKINGQLGQDGQLIEWPVPVGNKYLALVMRTWVTVQTAGDARDADKQIRLFCSMTNVEDLMEYLTEYLADLLAANPKVLVSTLRWELEREIALQLKYCNVTHTPETISYVCDVLLFNGGLDVRKPSAPSSGLLVTSFVLVQNPADVYDLPGEHEVVSNTCASEGYATDSMRARATVIGHNHAKFWRERYPEPVSARNLRQYNKHANADDALAQDILLLVKGDMSESEVTAREIARCQEADEKFLDRADKDGIRRKVKARISRAKK